jgi:hypothetical protein
MGHDNIYDLKDKIKGSRYLHNLFNFGKLRRLAVFGDGAGK